MAGLKGKFLRREGTHVIFGSSRRPEWAPIEISGQLDYNQLRPDLWYELELEGNRLVRFKELPPMRRNSGPSGGPRAGGRLPADPNVIPKASLMASATGFAKSAMESKMVSSWMEAAEAGKAWAAAWDSSLQLKPRETPPNPLPPDSPPLRMPDDTPPPPEPVPGLDDEGWMS